MGEPLNIHFRAFNAIREYQRSRSDLRLSQWCNRRGLVSIDIIRKDNIHNVWSWTFLLRHRIEASMQNRGFRDNSMCRNWIKLFDIRRCFKCCIDRATELLCPHEIGNAQIANRTYNGSCPFLDVIMSQ